jgi:hypothetical protein
MQRRKVLVLSTICLGSILAALRLPLFHPYMKSVTQAVSSKKINLSHIRQRSNVERLKLTRKCVNCDLSGADLSGLDLSRVNLQGANLSEATFKSCDFSSSNLRDSCFCYSNMLHCNFRLSDFSEGDLSMASIENSDFEGFSSLAFNLHKAFKRQALTFIHFEKNIPILDIPTFITSGDIMIIKIGKYMILNEIPHTFEYDFPLKSITK